jgi:hypothetical protein
VPSQRPAALRRLRPGLRALARCNRAEMPPGHVAGAGTAIGTRCAGNHAHGPHGALPGPSIRPVLKPPAAAQRNRTVRDLSGPDRGYRGATGATGTPASNQGPGRSLPGPYAGHPLHGAGGHRTYRRIGDAQAGNKPSRVLAVVIPVTAPQVARACGRNEAGRRASKVGKKGDEQTPTPGAAPGLAAPAAPIGKNSGRKAELSTCQPPPYPKLPCPHEPGMAG